MAQPVLAEVFTADELARAAGVERAAVDALVAAGELRLIPGTPFINAGDAIAVGRRLAPARPPANPAHTVRAITDTTPAPASRRRPGLPAVASSLLHGALIAGVIWSSTGTAVVAPVEEAPRTEERLVFIMTPGPGGGGGGGGLRSPLPAPPVQRRGPDRTRVPVPAVRGPVSHLRSPTSLLIRRAAQPAPHQPE